MNRYARRRQAEAEVARAQSRRRFMTGVALGTGALGLGLLGFGIRSVYHTNVPSSPISPAQRELTIDDARKYPELRQAFIDQLIRTNQIPHCSGVVYDHEGDKIQAYFASVGATEFIGGEHSVFAQGNYDLKTPDVLNQAGQGHPTFIFIGRQPFEHRSFSYMTAEDLRHVIVAHEGHHCQQHAQGLPYLSPQETLQGLERGQIHPLFLYHIAEHDAYVHDLPRLLRGEFKGSEYHMNDAKARFMENSLNLTKASRIARPLELRLLYGVQEAIAREPLLQDISVPSSYYEQKKRFK